MIARRILFFIFLLGIWGQAASACLDAHAASAAVQTTMRITASAVSEDFLADGGEQRCECSAMMQNVQSVDSRSSKSLIASSVEGAGAFLNSSNPDSVALAVHARASSFIARRSEQPPYLLALRLRQ